MCKDHHTLKAFPLKVLHSHAPVARLEREFKVAHRLSYAIHFFNTVSLLTTKGTDSPNPCYSPQPLWKDWLYSFIPTPFPTTKALCTPAMIAQLEVNINTVRTENILLIFTNGSESKTRAGAAFIPDDKKMCQMVHPPCRLNYMPSRWLYRVS